MIKRWVKVLLCCCLAMPLFFIPVSAEGNGWDIGGDDYGYSAGGGFGGTSGTGWRSDTDDIFAIVAGVADSARQSWDDVQAGVNGALEFGADQLGQTVHTVLNAGERYLDTYNDFLGDVAVLMGVAPGQLSSEDVKNLNRYVADGGGTRGGGAGRREYYTQPKDDVSSDTKKEIANGTTKNTTIVNYYTYNIYFTGLYYNDHWYEDVQANITEVKRIADQFPDIPDLSKAYLYVQLPEFITGLNPADRPELDYDIEITLIDYATYVDMMYSNSGKDYVLNYYFKVPDGRNSFDLTVEDIKGITLDYNYTTYRNMPDRDFLGLYDFDDNLDDKSWYEVVPTSNFVAKYSAGKYGNMLLKEGSYLINFSGDYITIPFNNDDHVFTISYYVKGILTTLSYAPSQWVNYVLPTVLLSGNPIFGSHFTGVSTGVFAGLTSKPAFLHGLGQYTSNTPVTATDGQYTDLTINFDKYYHIAISSDGDYLYYFLDGKLIKKVDYYLLGDINSITFRHNVDVDDLLINTNCLYTSDFTPPSSAQSIPVYYKTPDDVPDRTIALRTTDTITDIRIGGQRPYLPADGNVYVDVVSGNVASVDQFKSGSWQSIEGSFYKNGEWTRLVNADISDLTMGADPLPDDDPDPTPDPDKPIKGACGFDVDTECYLDSNGKYQCYSKGVFVGSCASGSGDSGTNIWDIIRDIIDGIGAIGNTIKEIIGGSLDVLGKVIGGLVDMLGKLLIPSEGFFTTLLDTEFPAINAKLGILGQPLDIAISTLNSIAQVEDTGGQISWSGISWQGVQLVPAGSFSFADVLGNGALAQAHSFALDVVDFGIWMGLLGYAAKQCSKFFGRRGD